MSNLGIPVADLVRAGLVVNLHMWLGSGFLYCPGCRRHTYHFAMSHPGRRDCYEVCRGCRSYHGTQKLLGTDQVPTAHEVIERSISG